MHARDIIDLFGGQSALATALDKGQSTVAYWAKVGVIPAKWHPTLLSLARERGIGLTAGDFVAGQVEAATQKRKGINDQVLKMPGKAAANQKRLDLGIQKQVEIDGVGMGVLSDGTPFLTGRGLARLCGVVHSVVQDVSDEWELEVPTPRVSKIREILSSHNNAVSSPYIEIEQRSGDFHAYPDTVCLALLEYYSFDAGNNIKDEAKRNYRLLAGGALREFIYTQVGYDPENALPEKWKYFHDRVSLVYNSVPHGYFGVFKEIADMIVTLGQAGLHIDEKFVPDISVGQHWSKHWSSNGGEAVYGARIKYEHNYPDYFPQALSNPQDSWCYPEMALGEFRRWFRETYIAGGKFANYIESKAKEKRLPVSFAQLAIAAYTQ
ncbi:MAG: hypothetical protein C4535_09815 [Comamonadaceae bacterium]|nr:MAG: hypothetical protein C4535_09815 [Comamonadaceae bacterium]